MATLYFDKVKRMVRLVSQSVRPRSDIDILVKGDVSLRVNMAGGKYYIDIGEYKEAIVAQPIVIGERVAFMVTTHSLSRLGLNVYTVEIANALPTLRNSTFLHNLIWNYVGMPCGAIHSLVNIISVRVIPGISDRRENLRVCEGYLVNGGTFFFATPASRSLATVVQYRFLRDSEGRMNAKVPERNHAA